MHGHQSRVPLLVHLPNTWYPVSAMNCAAIHCQTFSSDYPISTPAVMSFKWAVTTILQSVQIHQHFCGRWDVIQETSKFLCKIGWVLPRNVETISKKTGISISIAIATHLKLTQQLQDSNYRDLLLWTERSVKWLSNMAQYYIYYLTAASCPALWTVRHMTTLIQFNLAHSQFL